MLRREKYDVGDVVVSVGCFCVNSLREWQAHTRCLVVDYEATPETYLGKRELEKLNGTAMGTIECHPDAVTDRDGKIVLYRFKESALGNTVLGPARWRDRVDTADFIGTVEVLSTSMASVLSRFDRVRELWLNCEGAEIDILMNTPMDLLARCAYISVEFHRFSTFLNITNGDVMSCVDRLSSKFRAVCSENYHPYYEFFRNDT